MFGKRKKELRAKNHAKDLEIASLRSDVRIESTYRQMAEQRVVKLTALVNGVVNRVERDFPCRCVDYQPKCARCALLAMIAERREAPMYCTTVAAGVETRIQAGAVSGTKITREQVFG